MSGRPLRVIVVGCVVLAAAACAPKPTVPAPLSPRAEVLAVALPDGAWGELLSRRFFVRVPLPDRAIWRVDDTSGRWLVASHGPSKSMLWVRAWRAASVVNHAACEAEARPWLPEIFGKEPSALVDRRALDAPEGFDTELGFAARRSGEAFGGVAVAVGARVRQCLVVAYATRTDGLHADTVLADRLGFVAERILGRVESLRIDDRVAPESRDALAPLPAAH